MNDTVDSVLDRAVACHSAGDLAQAESLYYQVLLAAPTHPVALHRLGVLASQAGRDDVAIHVLDQAVAAAPTFAEAHASRGNALCGLGRLQEAVEAYDRALQLNPHLAEAANNRGSALLTLGQVQAALASYDQAIALKPDYAEAHVNRGNTMHTLARYREAVASYDRAIDANADSALAWGYRGGALQAVGQLEAALESYDRAVALNPGYAEAWSNRGNTLYALERYAEAVESCDRALATNPKLAEACSNRGSALLAMNRYEDALASYDQALALRPDHAATHVNRGNVLCGLARYQEALDSSDRAIALDASLADAWCNRGSALYALLQFQDAIRSFDRAIALKPAYERAHITRSHAQQQYTAALASEDMAPLLNTPFQAIQREAARIQSIPDKTERQAAIEALPPEIRSHPAISTVRAANFIRTLSTGHDLVFYCAPTEEIWNPRTARTKGAGGSEEAIVWLSQLLQRRGWNVTVFAGCGAVEREYDGVCWKPHWMWSNRDRQDVTVVWRHPRLLDQPIHSGKVVLDLHDVLNEGEFSPGALARIHTICVKSHFHRTFFPGLPDEKFAIIPNGIDSTLFEGPVERDPHLLINTASPDRSLEAFVDCFEQVKRQVPTARAQWAYGWQGWDTYPDLRPARRAWKARIQPRMREVGVEDLGRLNHKEVVGLYRRGNLYAYPSEMAEIDCISLSKAMAAGAVPVTTDFAAMGEKAGHGGVFLHSHKTKETWIKHGQTHYDITDPVLRARWVEETVRLLLDPPNEEAREAMRAWARATFDWEHIADRWHQVLVSERGKHGSMNE